MTSLHSSTTIDELTIIWRRLFQRSCIGVEENFFDLGGDPPLAVKLFTEFAGISGREVAPMAIYQAPTIASLARLLEQTDPIPLSPLVLLKRGTESPPIFAAHGLGGTVMDLFHLIASLDFPNPIYGMQGIGLDGISKPCESIEAVAQGYLDGIKQVQPNGPYFLIGYSFGGLVAFELAQRLVATGDSVRLLAMVDSYPHVRYLSVGQRVGLFSRLLGRRACRAMNWILRVRQNHPGRIDLYRAPAKSAFVPVNRRVHDSAYSAWRRYRPRFYAGDIKFLKAESASNFPDDPVAVWEHLAAQFECETVPGDHLGILTAHVETLAAVLSRHLRYALRR